MPVWEGINDNEIAVKYVNPFLLYAMYMISKLLGYSQDIPMLLNVKTKSVDNHKVHL